MADSTATRREPDRPPVQSWRIAVTAGPDTGQTIVAPTGGLLIGTSSECDLVLHDDAVSRQHLEIEIRADGISVRDLDSKNGTTFGGARIGNLDLPRGGSITLGSTTLSIVPDRGQDDVAPSASERCGGLRAHSEVMRIVFTQVERIASRELSVLLSGETGTGKLLIAEALHDLSPRRAAPFVVVDCTALSSQSAESELFGHVRKSVSGAIETVAGAFANAHGGTLLLDQIADLPHELQPKLLRVLEDRTVLPVGADARVGVDVRIVAAGNRDLRAAVQAGTFRTDLFYRLASVEIRVPPLRARLEDLPLLVEDILGEWGAPPLDVDSMQALREHTWPGNVRELRNVLARACALANGGAPVVRSINPGDSDVRSADQDFLELPYKDAKERVVERFTREYLAALLERHGGNISAAAREAGIDRNWIAGLLRRHGLRA